MHQVTDQSGISDDFLHFLLEFVQESDRAAVVLGAAMLDSQLSILLSKVLLPSLSTKEDLLEGNNPLSTFSARIKIAYRLGLIDADLARAIDLIRRLRNDFAHRIEAKSLNIFPHKDRVSELIRPLKTGQGYEDIRIIIEQKMNRPEISSVDFRLAVGVVASRLEEAILKSSQLASSNQISLYPPRWNA